MYSARKNKIFFGIYPHLIFIFELLNFKRRFRRSDSSKSIIAYLFNLLFLIYRYLKSCLLIHDENMKMIRSLVIKYCSLPGLNIKFLANYGLDVENLSNISNPSALCFGLHDNIEFEKGLAELFNFEVFAFDPTPISTKLFQEYKLHNFHYYPYAIGLYTSRVNFYMNSSLDTSGGSIINSKKNAYKLEVDSYCYVDLLEKFSLQKIELLKMDIDGGEIDIIYDLYNNHVDILPNQITLELDVKSSNLAIIDKFLFDSKKYYKIYFIPHKLRYSSFEILLVKNKI